MKLTFDQAIAIIKGSATAVAVIKGLITAGRGPANPSGEPMSIEDVDRSFDESFAEAKAEVATAGDEAQARIDRRTGGIK